MLLDDKENNDMEFPSMAANVSLWVVDEMTSLTHKSHAYGLSKAYHFMCLFRWFLEMKHSSQRAHSYEFTLV